MTKMDDELAEFKTSAKNFKYIIDEHSPSWLRHTFDAVMYHPGTPYFCLGMGVEAMGLAVQFYFQGSSYPVMDAIIALTLGYVVLFYHKKNPESVHGQQK